MTAQDITDRLVAARAGDAEAMPQLFESVYAELYRMAGRELGRQRVPTTLSSTALVNEAYVKLVDGTRANWKDRNHFFAVAATAMRHILVDEARRKLAEKRGAGAKHVSVDDVEVGFDRKLVELLELDEALRELASLSPRLSRVVELRFFGGLSVAESAEIMEVTERTVKRDWRKARAFLFDALNGQGVPEEPPD